MSNKLSILNDFIDIFPLTNCMLVAFPNFLIVGNPLYKNKQLFFEKYSYIKIRVCDIEVWYTFLCNMLLFFESDLESTPREVIISESNFSYELDASTKQKISIIMNGNTPLQKIKYFAKNEIEYLLNGISELNFKILCHPEPINICFNYLVTHFLKSPVSLDEVSSNIAMLTPSLLTQLCKMCCEKNQIKENPFTVSQILLRHIVNLLITFRIKRSNYMSSSLLQFYQNL